MDAIESHNEWLNSLSREDRYRLLRQTSVFNCASYRRFLKKDDWPIFKETLRWHQKKLVMIRLEYYHGVASGTA